MNRPGQHRNRGVALIIVLTIVVLLTALVVAYFSRSVTDRQLSNSSLNEASVDQLARSAANIVIGDLKQEIVNGSTAVYPSPSPASGTVYVPKTAANMVPQVSGVPTPQPAVVPVTWPIPNLVRRSVRDNGPTGTNPMPTPGVPSRASAVNSTTDLSSNGRSISSARWNSHYLLPRLKAGDDTKIDSTPINAFTPPDWVMVTKEKGPAVLTTPTKDDSGATVTAVGRYAYAIYDEGGLLDLNAAGYPTPGSPAALTGFTATQVGQKGGLALADLTVLGLTQAQVDNIVGWRNYASAQLGAANGSYNSFIFDSTASSKWFTNFVTGNTTGLMNVPLRTAGSPARTDQMLLGRQQLLALRSSLGFSQDVLQYLGTFSRDLEQPSFVPDPNASNSGALTASDPTLSWLRPKNTNHPLKIPLAAGSTGVALGYGGNDAYYATPPSQMPVAHQDDINPSLLTARDSAGLPILKRRFPLSRLALVVCPPAQADVANIKKYFGLVWDTIACRWTYTSPDGTAARSGIKTLDQIAKSQMVDGTGVVVTDPSATQREPDFFETLKAVTNCDSLGKQYGTNDGGSGASENCYKVNDAAVDGRVDYQVFQIGANIIDQYDADSYPTRICIADKPTLSGGGATWAIPYDNTVQLAPKNSTYPREIYGTENLPYMLGYMVGWYRTKTLSASDIDANYQPPSGTNVDKPPGASAVPSFAGHPFYEVAALIQPIIWNPSASGSNPVYSGASNYPASFQVVAGNIQKDALGIALYTSVYHSWWSGDTAGPPVKNTDVSQFPAFGGLTPASYGMAQIGPINTPTGVSPTYIQFQTSGTSDFREPYRLHAPLDPPGSNTSAYNTPSLSGVINTTDLEEGSFSQALGFYVGKAWAGPVWTDTSKHNYLDEAMPLGGSLRIHLQYKNPYAASPAYLTYDIIYFTYMAEATGVGQSLIGSDDSTNAIRAMWCGLRTGGDPRTNRWGLGSAQISPFWDPRIAKPTYTGYASRFPLVSYFPQGKSLATGLATDALIKPSFRSDSGAAAPGWVPSNPTTFAPVHLVLNSNTSTAGASAVQPSNAQYYMDPDGVARRASGAYFNPSTTDGLPLNTGNNTSRPVILNRPFNSIAELGYAFRGQAWKDIDFFTPESGDAALLDAFCLNELDNAPTDVAVAGRVNLNTKQPKVLQALIQGVSKAEGGIISTTEAANAAKDLVIWTTADPSLPANNLNGIFKYGPLRNRSELVGKFVSQVPLSPLPTTEKNTPFLNRVDGSKSYFGFSSALTTAANLPTAVVPPGTTAVFTSSTSAADAAIARRRECVLRALADSGNARTWNLMIDVIAQVGRYPAGATTPDKFVVTGETRYWIHVAIDRYTGQVIAKQIEPVSE